MRQYTISNIVTSARSVRRVCKDEADREHSALKIILVVFAQRLLNKTFVMNQPEAVYTVVCVNQ
jgi:hypothetical protein